MSIKKLLLTSALVAGFAGSALAHSTPTVTLGGSLDTQVGFRDQDASFDHFNLSSTDKNSKLSDSAIVNDTRLHVKVDGKAGNGLKYGGLVVLNADASTNKFSALDTVANTSSGGGLIISSLPSETTKLKSDDNGYQTMVYAETMFGRLEAGSYTGAYNALKVNGASVARATGGVDGDWQYWVNPVIIGGTVTSQTNGLVSDRFWTNPNLPSNYFTGGSDNAAKATYYTPTWMGFKAGVTFIPDMEQKGTVATTHTVKKDFSTGSSPYKGVVSGGLHYAANLQKIAIKAAVLGEMGDAKSFSDTQGREDLKAWELGLSANYMGFTLAGSYANLGDSGLVKATSGSAAFQGKDETRYWTLGAGYEYGAAGVSVTYMNSERGLLEGANTSANKFTNWSVGVDYKVAPGFMPYAEVSFYDLDEKDKSATASTAAKQENDGTVFLAGTKLSF